ncbi:hypothetical protein CO2235_150189 [Cupriavidus oxalaticus]|uniref:Uncharacterized protein n=1 Tax=Cupriavidus oxalaticus TaxID=96344 RepID=A0A375FZK5_9BURK|nr:hypothetical protein CO2235_150189 [Cupriavidus oxalaticus]
MQPVLNRRVTVTSHLALHVMSSGFDGSERPLHSNVGAGVLFVRGWSLLRGSRRAVVLA